MQLTDHNDCPIFPDDTVGRTEDGTVFILDDHSDYNDAVQYLLKTVGVIDVRRMLGLEIIQDPDAGTFLGGGNQE